MSLHRIYVIELRAYKKATQGERPWVYVGETTKDIHLRFEQHRAGVNSSIAPFVSQLRPDLAGSGVASTLVEARRLERHTARRLRNMGYSVKTDVELPALGTPVGRCPACGGRVVVSSTGCECTG